MEIFTLLNLRSSDSDASIKQKYYKKLSELHPSRNGNNKEFMKLVDSYKTYLLGEKSANCFKICDKNEKNVKCRCSGEYLIDKTGIIECDYCSCFIFVEVPPKSIL